MALGVTAYTEAPFGAEASDVIVYPLGIELTTQQNSNIIIGDANVPVTGQDLTTTEGNLNGFSLVVVETTGQDLSSNLGFVTEVPIGQQVDVTGFDLTANASNPTHDTLTAFGEAPFATLSPATFNIPVDVEATTGGIVGTFPLPMSLGTLSVVADANTGVTGQEITVQEGQAEADDASAETTGQALTSNLGTAVLDANTIASPSGIEMAMQPGQATADDASAEVTGIGFSANIGTAVLDANTIASPSGQEMTMQEGTATATDSIAIPTGILMSASLGSVKNVMWSEVNTGTIQPWTEVDTAA
jgi:hypothetical protein